MRKLIALAFLSMSIAVFAGTEGVVIDTVNKQVKNPLVKFGTGNTLNVTGATLLGFPAVTIDWGEIGGTLSDQTDLQAALNSLQPLDSQLTSLSGLSYSGNALKFVRVNSGETGFELASSSASINWGDIGGTLSNQTDLQSALNAKQNTLTLGNISDVGTDGISITGGTGAIIGSGVNISQHVADATHSGYLALSDFGAFNTAAAAVSAGAANWDTAFSERRQWDGGSTNLVAATGRTSLGATTAGGAIFTLANPSAITFLRVNADNSADLLSASAFRTAIGAGTGNGDALTTNPLSQFASTTSSQFKGVISDENAPDGASSKVIMALGSLSIASGKTGTFSNTLTFSGTDGSSLNIGTGGTLGSAAYTSSGDYATNVFKTITISGQSDVIADSTTDTLTLVAGSNITLTTNASTDTITIAATGGGGAPTDADYLVGTANGSLSAEIVVGTSPGGELGGSWASPTIDDGVSVSSWVLTSATITTGIEPTTNDGAALGTVTKQFSDLFLAEGAVINFDNGDATITQVGDVVTVGGADLKVTSPGNVSTSVVTTDGTQTLTNKTINSPTISTPSAFTTGGSITLAENSTIALDPAGSADGKFTGTTITATAGYTQAFGDLVYLDPTDSRWELCDANAASAADGDSRGIIGMVVVAGTDGTSCTILLHGVIRADAKFPALTVNGPCYVSETAGAITQTQPATTDVVIRIVGFALTADEIYFCPDNVWITHT